MERVNYENDEYRCPRCGGLMIANGDGSWECSECDIPGVETWDDEKGTGHLDVDIEAWENYLEESERQDEERMRDQIAEYESYLNNEERKRR